MPEKKNSASQPQGSGVERAALTGSGALQLVQTVTENPPSQA